MLYVLLHVLKLVSKNKSQIISNFGLLKFLIATSETKKYDLKIKCG